MLALFFAVLLFVGVALLLHRLGRLDVNGDGKVNREDLTDATNAVVNKIKRTPAQDPEPVQEVKKPRKKRTTTSKQSPDESVVPETPTEPVERQGDTGEVL